MASKKDGAVPRTPLDPQRAAWWQQWAPVIMVALVSILAATVVDAGQQRSLGDEPGRMILCGCGIAAVAGLLRWGRPILIGVAAMVGFPALALVDLILHGGHSLLGIEFAFYALYGGVGVLTAVATRAVRARAFPVL
jgi:hypothetical protein